MSLLRHLLAGVHLVLLTFVTSPLAGEGDAPANVVRAQSLLERAVDRLQREEHGGFAALSRAGEFTDDELYVYVVDRNGIMLASSGTSVTLVGRDLTDLKDSDGKAFIREILARAKQAETGLVEYRWLNQQNGRIERKIALFRTVGDNTVVVGYYVPRGSVEQAKSLLWRAVHELKLRGESALRTFSDLNGGFIQGDLYVYVVAADSGKMLAHGTMPQLIGRDAKTLRDPVGDAFIIRLIDLARKSSEGELSYKWMNPTMRKPEDKRAFFVREGNYILVVGAYRQ